MLLVYESDYRKLPSTYKREAARRSTREKSTDLRNVDKRMSWLQLTQRAICNVDPRSLRRKTCILVIKQLTTPSSLPDLVQALVPVAEEPSVLAAAEVFPLGSAASPPLLLGVVSFAEVLPLKSFPMISPSFEPSEVTDDFLPGSCEFHTGCPEEVSPLLLAEERSRRLGLVVESDISVW